MNSNIKNIIGLVNQIEYNLKLSLKYLNKSRSWGILDIFGGGLFTTLIKRNNMKEAQSSMNTAKALMGQLRYQLQGIDEYIEFEIEDSSLYTIFDYLADGFIADFLVQSKIKKAKEEVESALYSLSNLKERLSRMDY